MEPSVCAICITADRPEMTAEAVEAFERQTYGNKRLVIYDTSTRGITRYPGHFQHCEIGGSVKTVGELRNSANALAAEDVLLHWDSDDLSHPYRIAEQVALLQSSGADVVGYNRMLFWDTRWDINRMLFWDTRWDTRHYSAAWIYTGEILGTSLCYWRPTWEQTPFRDRGWHNEDFGFVTDVISRGGKVVAEDSVVMADAQTYVGSRPRMVARIHAGNAKNSSYQNFADAPLHWKRAPEWADYCRRMCEP